MWIWVWPDWVVALVVVDVSAPTKEEGLGINLFAPEERLLPAPQPGDIIRLHRLQALAPFSTPFPSTRTRTTAHNYSPTTRSSAMAKGCRALAATTSTPL
jgi:hypothetical protein